MGENLALNLADHGYGVAVYNRTSSKVDDFLTGPGKDTGIIGSPSIEDLIGHLEPPRRILVMVKAGTAVDAVIEEMAPLLERGDILIDGGNSHYRDTIRRHSEVEAKGLLYVGMGVSGGQEGARHGPSLMPGGSQGAWEHLRDMLQAISAKVADGTPCADWIGPDGSGHFVKMVHNAIEYADMQLIAEAYHLMRTGLGMSHDAMANVFSEWDKGPLESFLIQITGEILAYADADGQPLVTKIVDAAGQKGTGRWTVEEALDLGSPVPLFGEAVFARSLSGLLDQRRLAAGVLEGPSGSLQVRTDRFLPAIHDALYASKIVSYAQGFSVLREASSANSWELDYGRIALLWRQGCIIRAAFLEDITSAFRAEPGLTSLLLDPGFRERLASAQDNWRLVVAQAAIAGVPVPAYATALSFYDGYRSERLPANLIQAQRDYFGAHTYERLDAERGEFFHTDWTGSGGATTAGSYQA